MARINTDLLLDGSTIKILTSQTESPLIYFNWEDMVLGNRKSDQ